MLPAHPLMMALAWIVSSAVLLYGFRKLLTAALIRNEVAFEGFDAVVNFAVDSLGFCLAIVLVAVAEIILRR